MVTHISHTSAVACILLLSVLAPFCHAECGEWQQIQTHPEHPAMSSSELSELLGGRRVTYSADLAVDGDTSTCWVEGAEGPGIGEWLLVSTVGPVREIEVTNGFARSQTLFGRNNRVKLLQAQIIPAFTAPGLVTELDYVLYFGRSCSDPVTLELEDTSSPQGIRVPWTVEEQEEMIWTVLEGFFTEHEQFGRAIERELGYSDTTDLSGRQLAAFLRDVQERYLRVFIRLVIHDVYPGSAYDDTCITEVRLIRDD